MDSLSTPFDVDAVGFLRELGVCFSLKDTNWGFLDIAESVSILYPYAWCLVTAGHSYVHLGFTYRTQLVTVLCALLVAIEILARVFPPRRGQDCERSVANE